MDNKEKTEITQNVIVDNMRKIVFIVFDGCS